MMKNSETKIVLSEEDYKEIFSLFTSSTKYEREQIYKKGSGQHFKDVNPYEEYSLTQERREFAMDAWRAVVYFLKSKGFSLFRNEKVFDISWIDEDFIE